MSDFLLNVLAECKKKVAAPPVFYQGISFILGIFPNSVASVFISSSFNCLKRQLVRTFNQHQVNNSMFYLLEKRDHIAKTVSNRTNTS